MKKQLDMLVEFHTKFKAWKMWNIPKNLDLDRAKFRHALMKEEIDEYLEWVENNDLENIAKELCDILQCVYWTAVEHNLQDVLEECFEEVHRSNMSKDYWPKKMIKWESYSPADLSKIIK